MIGGQKFVLTNRASLYGNLFKKLASAVTCPIKQSLNYLKNLGQNQGVTQDVLKLISNNLNNKNGKVVGKVEEEEEDAEEEEEEEERARRSARTKCGPADGRADSTERVASRRRCTKCAEVTTREPAGEAKSSGGARVVRLTAPVANSRLSQVSRTAPATAPGATTRPLSPPARHRPPDDITTTRPPPHGPKLGRPASVIELHLSSHSSVRRHGEFVTLLLLPSRSCSVVRARRRERVRR